MSKKNIIYKFTENLEMSKGIIYLSESLSSMTTAVENVGKFMDFYYKEDNKVFHGMTKKELQETINVLNNLTNFFMATLGNAYRLIPTEERDEDVSTK